MKLAWSVLARTELAEIRRYSVERWGRDVAVGYLTDLRDAALAAAAQPETLRQLRGPYRLRRVRSPVLILHVDSVGDRLTEARVLHIALDLERHLP